MQETPVTFLGHEGPLEKGYANSLQYSWATLVAQLVKNPLAMWETWVWSLGWGHPLNKRKATHSSILAWRTPWTPWGHNESDTIEQLSLSLWASLVAQTVKNPPAMQETLVRSLGQEDPLEKRMATHFSVHAWRIPWTEKPGGLQSMESQRVGHTERLTLTFSNYHGEKNVYLPQKTVRRIERK